jgi:lipoate---protein ligase
VSRLVRVIDTGLRSARWNIAFDQALIELHRDGRIPDTIRFLRFPRSALVGRHQALAREIHLDWCRANGVEIARRITGGGAIWFEPAHLGWELVLPRAAFGARLDEVTERICQAAAAGLRRLGLDAAFRPRNDIEVAGRKISGTGGFFDGGTLFYQGTVLCDLDVEAIAQALVLPVEKLGRRGLALLAERVTTVRRELGSVPDLESLKTALLAGLAQGLDLDPAPGALAPVETELADQLLREEIGTASFIEGPDLPAAPDALSGTKRAAGGLIEAHVRLRPGAERRIRQVVFTGDFFCAPPRAVVDLEAALAGVPATAAPIAVERFFAARSAAIVGAGAEDFAAALAAALAPN